MWRGYFFRAWLLMACAAARAEFPEPFDTEMRTPTWTAAAAAQGFRMPPGFNASVFAQEPDVRQPIAMTFDPRGRLWVAENYTYAESKVNFATQLNDRVLILEDRDHDGHFDHRTVFYDQAKILTSVEVGNDGVYLLCPPRLLFLPDRNHDDVPDGAPEVLLDGFATTTGNRHTFANGLKWGPDGWLWGRVGISSGARIGRPGEAETNRVEMRGGVWRYHPSRRVFEAVSHGTTNPWGLDWNELGEPFFINTVIGHLWHAIPGAHFQRMHGDDVNPHAYRLIEQHADHYHFDTGAGWTKSRAALDGSSFATGSDALGGGHAHAGLMFYLGTNWPDSYRDRLFTLNFHGRRMNEERLVRQGSGYVGQHEPDLMQMSDPWFRGLDLMCGPDGTVFLSDWSDTGECHDQDGVHRNSGRIYRVSYGTPPTVGSPDLLGASGSTLVEALFSQNEWLGRQARRVLADRSGRGEDQGNLASQLEVRFASGTNAFTRLRALWGLQALGANTTSSLLSKADDPDESVRSWVVRLLVDDWPMDDPTGQNPFQAERRRLAQRPYYPRVCAKLVEFARNDPSPFVRLYLASALQRLDLPERARVADGLLSHREDVTDHNLPGIIWFGVEPLVVAQTTEALELAKRSQIPFVREAISRRLAEDIEVRPESINLLLATFTTADAAAQADIVQGLVKGLRGWRKVAMPSNWARFAMSASPVATPEVQTEIRELSSLFGDGRALDELRAVLADPKADPRARQRALTTLLDSPTPELKAQLRQLADDASLRTPALVGLLRLGEPGSAELAINRYLWVGLEERPALLNALVARTNSALALVDAVVADRIPKRDLTPFLARQLANLNDPAVSERLRTLVDSAPPKDATKKASIERYRATLTTESLAKAESANGRRLFTQLCAGCHRLFGEGGMVGPDLTGSGRSNIDYLLENLVDPNALVPADYRMAIVTLKDGTVFTGLLRDATPRTVSIQNPTETTTLDRSGIQSIEQPGQSMMPEGLLEALEANQVRDLIAYLMSPTQVPLAKP